MADLSPTLAAVYSSTVVAGAPLTVTVGVTMASKGGAVTAGTVSLYVDGTYLRTVALDAEGTATFTLPAGLAPGPRKLKLVYDGGALSLPSTAETVVTFTTPFGPPA